MRGRARELFLRQLRRWVTREYGSLKVSILTVFETNVVEEKSLHFIILELR